MQRALANNVKIPAARILFVNAVLPGNGTAFGEANVARMGALTRILLRNVFQPIGKAFLFWSRTQTAARVPDRGGAVCSLVFLFSGRNPNGFRNCVIRPL